MPYQVSAYLLYLASRFRALSESGFVDGCAADFKETASLATLFALDPLVSKLADLGAAGRLDFV